jgi:SAM-dependent methyltransferase
MVNSKGATLREDRRKETQAQSNTPYTVDFYKNHRDGSHRSAREIVPLVIELVQPKSVIDVGCGVGTWLSVFNQCGVQDFCGIDGDYVDRNMLEIPEQCFFVSDLTGPIQLNRQFDLVVSLEVAEHLPDTCAEIFVDSLTKLGPVILFSAAIPHQGGTHHVNEQWPDYWVKYFQALGYSVIDCIRSKIWANDKVDYCYAQNTFLFVRKDYLEKSALLKAEHQSTNPALLSIVHPNKYLEVIGWIQQLYSLSEEITALASTEEAVILVDQGAFGNLFTGSPRVIPFLKRHEKYPGAPPDDATAVQELERLRSAGAACIVFAWPAFWWLDHFNGFNQYLRSKFCCIMDNKRIVAFDLLRSPDLSCRKV